MEIFLDGNDYRYAVEQMLLTLYPEERPVYPECPSGADSVRVTVRQGKRYATAVCHLQRNGMVFAGRAAVSLTRIADQMTKTRLEQRIVRLSFYRAALAAGHENPSWGALTGVRPGKLMASLLSSGLTEREALRVFREDFGVAPEKAALCLTAVRAGRMAKMSLAAKDVCLYIGIPFCPSRCAYCSFVSVDVTRQLSLLPEYLSALERELEALADAVREADLRLVSIYVGGGTPTTLSAEQLSRLLGRLEELFSLEALRELTVEAGRPDTVTRERMRTLALRGTTRVSVNPQTMSDAVLEAIGRRHTTADVYEAVNLVRQSGSFALNMDLIAGLPGDTPAAFAQTVDAVLALDAENVTVHTLALKKGSRFLTEGTPLPGAEEVRQMLETARARLTAAGYEPYYLYRQKFMSGGFENVGWAKLGHANLYNMCIMEELTGIIAAGAGGSTKLITPGGAVRRLTAPKYPKEYIERIGDIIESKQTIPAFYNTYFQDLERK